ncbi:hypothetical protein [Eubacterium limosum]|uniref:hypothetical protein n=1 Tax=Eubacterium limosum TaxID=1736 RepID=UPI001063D45E|nr:hypothetical protein [Eubacterium limosum]
MIREDRWYIHNIITILMILVLLLDFSGAFSPYIGTAIILLLFMFGYLICYDSIPKYAFGLIGGYAVGMCIAVSLLS